MVSDRIKRLSRKCASLVGGMGPIQSIPPGGKELLEIEQTENISSFKANLSP